MGALTFFLINSFFLKGYNCGRSTVCHVREDNGFQCIGYDYTLVWTTWTPMAVKLHQSRTHSLRTFVTINTLRPRQNGRHFADCIFMNENVWFPIKISLKFVPKGLIKNIPELVQIMAWRRSGDKPLSEAMMVCLPTHICVARPHWVKNRLWLTKCVALWHCEWLDPDTYTKKSSEIIIPI